jgi:sugar phosphate permease
MSAEFGWSRTDFFFAVSLRSWLGIAITPFIGHYLDRPNGPRVLAAGGGILNTISIVLIPFADAPWQFAALFGGLGGIAQAATSGLSGAIVPKWFLRQRGSAVAISTAGGGMAAIVLAPFVAIVTATAGWRAAWLVMGVLAFVIGTLPTLLLRREPEDLGLLPDGRHSSADESRGPTRSQPASEVHYTLEQALHTRVFWVLLLGIALGSLANNGLPAMMGPIFVDRGYAFELAAAGLTTYGIASFISKLAWGWVSNRLAIRTVLLILTVYGAFALPSVVLVPELGPLGYGFLIGVYIGAYYFLSQMVWSEYFGRAHVGAISALGRPVGLMVGASGPFILALTRDWTGSYDRGIWLNALSAALCFGCLFLVQPARRSTG